MVQRVSFHHIGHLSTARSAPACPKINKGILVAGHVIRYAHHFALGSLECNVGVFLTYGGGLPSLQLVVHQVVELIVRALTHLVEHSFLLGISVKRLAVIEHQVTES